MLLTGHGIRRVLPVEIVKSLLRDLFTPSLEACRCATSAPRSSAWNVKNLWRESRGGSQIGFGGSGSTTLGVAAPNADPMENRAGCPAKWRARFVKHVTVPDGSVLNPGTSFIKTWRFRNESNEPWPLGSKLLFVGKNSDHMGGPDEVPVGRAVEGGQEVDVSVPLIAPSQPGVYFGFWRMAEPSGKRFGQRVRIQIQVQGADSASSSSSDETEVKSEATTTTTTVTPTSTSTPTPTSTPTQPENKTGDVVGFPCPPADLFTQLQAMGFTNQTLNMRLARKHNGDVVKIVKKLMKIQRRELLATRRT